MSKVVRGKFFGSRGQSKRNCLQDRAHIIQWCFTGIDTTVWLPQWHGYSHYGDVIMGASPLFTQPFIQTQIKENIKAPRHWPLCGEFPAQMTSYAESVSIWWRDHAMKNVGKIGLFQITTKHNKVRTVRTFIVMCLSYCLDYIHGNSTYTL